MSIHRLEEMTWIEIDDLDRENTVVWIPISPIEEHGPHLPLGTDLFGARPRWRPVCWWRRMRA